MSKESQWVRPKPVLDAPNNIVLRQRDTQQVVTWLREDRPVWLRGHFGLGVRLIEALYAVQEVVDGLDFASRRGLAQEHRAEARGLLVRVCNHRIDVPGAPEIGFLKELYSELDVFFLPLIDIQALFGAWQSYDRGTMFPVLGHRLHPFWGTYLPNRMTHLELFGTWLSQYSGSRNVGVDVGVGCGVLALMMCRAGFTRVIGTDSNVNAVESVVRETQRVTYPTPVELIHTDLLSAVSETPDLIVFNPPWVPGEPADTIEQALMYRPGLFERFFEQAHARLDSDGRIVLVFSNVLGLVRPDAPHPIEQELCRERFILKAKQQRKVKGTKGADGRTRRTRERVEIWELARAPES